MTDSTDTAVRAIVEADNPHPAAPDLVALKDAGRRQLHRRRAFTGLAATAAAGVLAVPAFLAISGDDERATDPAGHPPATGVQCGQLLCVDPEGKNQEFAPVEKAEVIGQWVGNDLGNGAEEVLYVARTKGFHQKTGKEQMVDVVMLGYNFEGKLHRVVWGPQPGSEAVSPDGDPSRFYLNPLGESADAEYSVVGFVESSPEAITWSTPDGEQGQVDGIISDALPGYTLFHVSRPMPEGYEPGRFDKKLGPQGEDGAIEIGPSSGAWPPDLTIHTSDGWSCSLADCGSVG